MGKSNNKLNPSFMWETYKQKKIPYSLRRGISRLIANPNTQKNRISSLNFRGSVLWNNLPIKLKECKSLQELNLLLSKVETYSTLSQRVKHKEFWLSVVLFLNFNIYGFFIQCMYVNIFNLFVGIY